VKQVWEFVCSHPFVALSENEMLINGEGSLLTRPMDFFDEVMPEAQC
jgi:hypothetical protein